MQNSRIKRQNYISGREIGLRIGVSLKTPSEGARVVNVCQNELIFTANVVNWPHIRSLFGGKVAEAVQKFAFSDTLIGSQFCSWVNWLVFRSFPNLTTTSASSP